jgi:hypothetical protein
MDPVSPANSSHEEKGHHSDEKIPKSHDVPLYEEGSIADGETNAVEFAETKELKYVKCKSCKGFLLIFD